MEAEHYPAIFCRTVANVNDGSADADCAEGISWHPHVIDLSKELSHSLRPVESEW